MSEISSSPEIESKLSNKHMLEEIAQIREELNQLKDFKKKIKKSSTKRRAAVKRKTTTKRRAAVKRKTTTKRRAAVKRKISRRK